MSQKNLPAWLKEEDAEPLQTSSNNNYNPIPTTSSDNYNTTKSNTATTEPSLQIQLIHWAMKVILMCLCMLMFVTAILGIGLIDGVESSGKFFIAAYMLFFSSLLFSFELMRIKPVPWIDNMLLRNFGFLYGILGKSLFIIFIAFLSFGLGVPESLSTATGTCLGIYGIAQVVIYLKYPEFFDSFNH